MTCSWPPAWWVTEHRFKPSMLEQEELPCERVTPRAIFLLELWGGGIGGVEWEGRTESPQREEKRKGQNQDSG